MRWLFWCLTSAWVFSCGLGGIFRGTFHESTSGGLLLHTEYSLNIYIFLSTHLTQYMCVLKHQHFIYFSIFSGLDDKTFSLLQVLFSLITAVEIYTIMHICTRAYAYTVYTHMYAYTCMCVCVCVSVCMYICIYFLKFCMIF